jgi:hypothetical protein
VKSRHQNGAPLACSNAEGWNTWSLALLLESVVNHIPSKRTSSVYRRDEPQVVAVRERPTRWWIDVELSIARRCRTIEKPAGAVAIARPRDTESRESTIYNSNKSAEFAEYFFRRRIFIQPHVAAARGRMRLVWRLPWAVQVVGNRRATPARAEDESRWTPGDSVVHRRYQSVLAAPARAVERACVQRGNGFTCPLLAVPSRPSRVSLRASPGTRPFLGPRRPRRSDRGAPGSQAAEGPGRHAMHPGVGPRAGDHLPQQSPSPFRVSRLGHQGVGASSSSLRSSVSPEAASKVGSHILRQGRRALDLVRRRSARRQAAVRALDFNERASGDRDGCERRFASSRVSWRTEG